MKKKTGSDKSYGSGLTPTWKPCKTSLFVYGTLLSGARAHTILLSLEATSPARAVLPHHDLYHFPQGDYPLVYPGQGNTRGEVWEIPLEALLLLDIYEGVHEGLYERCFLEVSTAQGTQKAWVYRATPRAMERLKGKLKKVSGSDWLSWKERTTS